jgi:hypothetical protein
LCVSNETASRPNKRLMRTYHWISLFMSYKVSKLAYRIWVILIANARVKKKIRDYVTSTYERDVSVSWMFVSWMHPTPRDIT